MKRFRVNNLTIAIDNATDLAQKCGVNFSCPIGSIDCHGFTINCNFATGLCDFRTLVGCDLRTLGCGAISRCGFSGGCRFNFSPIPTDGGCGTNFSTLRPIDVTELVQATDPVDRASLIAGMKADLKVALEQLDAVEIESAQPAQPQTLEEANALEVNLESALTEVRAMKDKLGK